MILQLHRVSLNPTHAYHGDPNVDLAGSLCLVSTLCGGADFVWIYSSTYGRFSHPHHLLCHRQLLFPLTLRAPYLLSPDDVIAHVILLCLQNGGGSHWYDCKCLITRHHVHPDVLLLHKYVLNYAL